jgi:hypothetical protein
MNPKRLAAPLFPTHQQRMLAEQFPLPNTDPKEAAMASKRKLIEPTKAKRDAEGEFSKEVDKGSRSRLSGGSKPGTVAKSGKATRATVRANERHLGDRRASCRH